MMEKMKNSEQKTVGILLAGGMSRRFGKPKAFQEWKGKAFYEFAYDALQSVCDEVVIVTRPQFVSRFPKSLSVTVDLPAYDGCGPLAGIYTGMEKIAGEQYVVLPCDMPLINREIIQNLFQNHQFSVTVVDTESGLQPLVSIWDHACKPMVKEALDEQDYAIRVALNKLQLNVVSSTLLSEEPERFINVNTTRQFKEMIRWLKS